MKLDNLIIREFEKQDADIFFNLYKEEYGSYFEFTSPEELCKYAIQETAVSKILQLKNAVIGGYFVTYDKEQKIGYPHGLIIDKKFRAHNIYKGFIINPSNFNGILENVFDKFQDIDIFYSIVRGYSRSANSAMDLMGFQYGGLVPSIHKAELSPSIKKRDPGVIRILYPQKEKVFHKYYDKDLFKDWKVPEIIPELYPLTKTVIDLLRLEIKPKIKIMDIKIKHEDTLKDYIELYINENTVKFISNECEAILYVNIDDNSANISLKSTNYSTLYAFTKRLLDQLRDFDIISVDVSTAEEQRILYDLGFRAVVYLPLFKLLNNRRYDVFRFIKLRTFENLFQQKAKLLKIQRGHKIKKIINTVFDNFTEKDLTLAPLLN